MTHISWDVLEKRRLAAEALAPVDSVQEHYKTHDLYRVVGHTIIEATDQPGVRYVDVDHPKIEFTRPLLEFLGPVEYDGQLVPRFREVT